MSCNRRTVLRWLLSAAAMVTAAAGISSIDRDGARDLLPRTETVSVGVASSWTPDTADMRHLPMPFEVNRGQTDSRVKYLARGHHFVAFFLRDETVLLLGPSDTEHGAVISMRLVGESPDAAPSAEGELASRVSYFIGNDRSRWQRALPTYGTLRYGGIYPGVDLLFYGSTGRLEHDFRVAPRANPGVITWEISGADRLELTRAGDLAIHAGGIDVSLRAPTLYQEGDRSRELVDGGYELVDRNHVRFRIGDYDPNRTLVIDPFIEYSTYVGGSGNDRSFAPAVDPGGNVYITGTTDSLDFPTIGPLQPRNAGGFDVFVTKLSANGSTVLYSVYLGGSGRDQGFGIVATSGGEAYVAGDTTSRDFPALKAIQGFGGTQDAFVAKLTRDGTALAYSTYLGGADTDGAFDVRVDSKDRGVVVSGTTESDDFPLRRPVQSTRGGGRDIFVAKLTSGGSALVYSTYLGGSLNEGNGALWLDSAGRAFVAGNTASPNFPLVHPLQSAYGGGMNDAFLSQIATDGSRLLFSTYLGGSAGDLGFAVTVDAADQPTIVGRTNSSNFPTVRPIQSGYAGGNDIFVAKLSRNLKGYIYATYLGGTGDENAFGAVADARGNVHLSGWTTSTNFPTANPVQARNNGGEDVVFAALNPRGSALVYSTYFGGTGNERGDYIVADWRGGIYASGWTSSADFPTYLPVQPTYGGGTFDAFVVKISP